MRTPSQHQLAQHARLTPAETSALRTVSAGRVVSDQDRERLVQLGLAQQLLGGFGLTEAGRMAIQRL